MADDGVQVIFLSPRRRICVGHGYRVGVLEISAVVAMFAVAAMTEGSRAGHRAAGGDERKAITRTHPPVEAGSPHMSAAV